jgi:hypothetical protein
MTDLAVNQIGRQCRQSVILAVRPAKFDCHIAAPDETSFAQTLVERAQTVRHFVGRSDAEKPCDRHRRLLRARRERPRGRRAAEQRDELAPFQFIELHSIPTDRAGLQDNELARISHEITERFSSLLAVGDGGRRTLLVPLGADTSQQSFLTTPQHA